VNKNSKSSNDLNTQRRLAVQLRLSGSTLADVRNQVGLSTPTIVAAVKAFKQGGWQAVDVKPRGRPKRSGTDDSDIHVARVELLKHMLHGEHDTHWTTQKVRDWLKATHGKDVGLPTVAGYLQNWELLPENRLRQTSESTSAAAKTWMSGEYLDFKSQAKATGASVLWFGLGTSAGGSTQLYVHTLRGRCIWLQLENQAAGEHFKAFLHELEKLFPKGIALVVPDKHVAMQVEKLSQQANKKILHLLAPSLRKDHSSTGSKKKSPIHSDSFAGTNGNNGHKMKQAELSKSAAANDAVAEDSKNSGQSDSGAPGIALPGSENGLSHLQQLEAESIHIMREVVAEADNPGMLYSIGKDSAVMLHLARKAFYPAPPPFPLLHVDTTWKFQEMYRFRDKTIEQHGLELLTHVNPDGVAKGVNPFDHGSALHTDIMKTQALKQALEKYRFDVTFAGARRDEEASRAKERVFSFRTSGHRWEPKNQRPELWNIYNTKKQPGESIRAFPLSNWTELDIWQYIKLQNIPVVPLYFAAERPVVERDGMLIMVDDDRMPLNDGEVPMMRSVRFRTLGCYPLTGAIESTATTLPEIIQEMLLTSTSERKGRMIDHDSAGSMEKKKQEGYF